MTVPSDHDAGALVAAQVERRWAILSACLVGGLVLLALLAGIHRATMPQTWVETVDPRTLHVSGEFIESNLGSAVERDGSVTTRVVAQQFSFTPQCLLVPADTPILFRATSADVLHGFMVNDTNINGMLVPGYVTALPARFARPGEHAMPCHEFCGLGHEGMWARVKVIEKATFLKMAAERRRLSCVDE
jgi:cytochrome c oxidase subunit 2